MKKLPIEYASLILMFLLLLTYKKIQISESPNPEIDYFNEGDPLEVGLYTFIGYGPLFVAKNQGFFDSVGLAINLHKIEGDPERRAALASGKIDVATHTLDALVVLRANGLDAQAFLALDASLGADGIIAIEEIQSVGQLSGKTVAFASGTPSHFFLQRILDEVGLSMKDIVPKITDSPDKAAQAFISGEVDAAVSWEPWITNATLSDGRVLVGSDMRPYLIKDVMYANRETIENRSRELLALTKAWFLTVDWINEHPDQAKMIIGDEFGIPREEMELIFPKVHYQDLSDNRRAFKDDNNIQSLYRLYGTVSEVWMNEEIIPKPDFASEGLYPYFFTQH